MKLMPCPLNGPRNISEFIYGGEVADQPNPNRCSDAAWADFLFMANNTAGLVREWWCHLPSGYWFIAERERLSDEIVRTYPASALFGKRIDFASPSADGEP